MTCTRPRTVYWSKEISAAGKRLVTSNRNNSLTGIPFEQPCGKCPDCRLNRAGDWAVRCVHEAKLHDENCFLTLTYDNEHLPYNGPFPTLRKRDLSLFAKRLHNRLLKSRGRGIRYYGAGEYGDKNGRPHYHIIIFDYDFKDKKFFKNNDRGEPLFRSAELASLWPVGWNTIGAVTFESCSYVARYVMDKIDGKMFDDKYTWMHEETGELVSIEPESPVMSRRPGLGTEYYSRFGSDIARDDNVVVQGRVMRVPRFYDNKLAAIDPDRLAVLKLNRMRKARFFKRDMSSRRMRIREVITLKRLSLKARSVT